MFSEAFLDQIRQHIPLFSVVSRHVRLIKKGRHFVGLCPFHTEKTASFSIQEHDQHYHCFGCGAHGDLFDFIQRIQSVSFTEAVTALAEQANLPLETQVTESKDKRSLYEVAEWACTWYQTLLKRPEGEPALAYLEKRGVAPEDIQKFRLGFAAEGFLQSAKHNGVPLKLLEEVGLLIASDRGPYPRFRQRIMFPIADEKSRIIAFGGRQLKGEGPKYLNSPENALFSKRRVLYGMPHTLPREERWFVVEGYLDVIAVQKYSPCVAPLGTAMGIEQLQAVWRYSKTPVVCFDGDSAGRRAALSLALKALPVLRPAFDIYFALLPAGEDPHSFLQAYGWSAFAPYKESALSLCEFLWFYLSRSHDLKKPAQRSAADALWKQWTETISDPSVRFAYRSFFRDQLFRSHKGAPKLQGTSVAVPPALHQKILLGILALCPHILLQVYEMLAHLIVIGDDWIALKQALLDFCETEEQETPELMSFLQQKTGIFWREKLSDILLHIPQEIQNNSDDLCAYWTQLFSLCQESVCKQQELKDLKEKIIDGEAFETEWEALKILRQQCLHH